MISPGILILNKNILCLRILFQSRNATRNVLNPFFPPSFEVGIEPFSKGPHIHLEDLNSHARNVLHGEHGLFGRIHTADRTAIITLLFSRSHALEECDLLW